MDLSLSAMIDRIPQIYYNPDRHSLVRTRIHECESDGFMVVHGSRPLGGHINWENPYLRGIFWTADKPVRAKLDYWHRYGAYRVRLTDNDEIVVIAAEIFGAADQSTLPKSIQGKSWEQITEKYGMRKCIALFDQSLPYCD